MPRNTKTLRLASMYAAAASIRPRRDAEEYTIRDKLGLPDPDALQ